MVFIKRLISTLITCLLLIARSIPYHAEGESPINGDFRGVWVASVSNLDFPSKPGLAPAELKAEIDALVRGAKDMGLNAIVLQVRPTADALYKSEIFPWSYYLTGTQGAAPSGDFDPLAYWVDKCHEQGVQLHAWLNPYRVTMKSAALNDVNKLSPNNPARINPGLTVKYDGAVYFNPGLPECRSLIVRGVEEIVKNYDVDGIHLDDYFYPGAAFADDAAYKQYGNGVSLSDWRRENVNTLVREIKAAVSAIKPDVRFGVAPCGIWQNKSSSELGSDTKGFESYKSIYSDSRKWVKDGLIDYICPQIYWTIGYSVADYEKLLKWWINVCEGTGVDLYIGHAAYREALSEGGWAGEMLRQLNLNAQTGAVSGSVFFRATLLTGTAGDGIKQYYAGRPIKAPEAKQRPGYMPDGLLVSQPAKDVTVYGAKGYTFLGVCDPNAALFVNGQKITKVTPEGFFSCYKALTQGENKFTFTQEGGESQTRVITLKPPQKAQPAQPAPVPVKIAREKKMYAVVTADLAWAYPSCSVSGGSSWALPKGRRDLVVASADGMKWVKLSCGAWVEAANISIITESVPNGDVLSGGVYEKGPFADAVVWKAKAAPADYVLFDGNSIEIYFGLQTEPPQLDLGGLNDKLIKSVSSGISSETPYYSFSLKDDAKIEGVYTEFTDGLLRLVIKKRKTLSAGAKPLDGFTFVIDAGHGQDDSGALGPLGGAYAEKHLNLINARKLSARLELLGAKAIKTRDADVFYTLHERTVMSFNAKPDMFISIHANSMAETTDSSEVRGLTVWYKNAAGGPLAALLSNKLAKTNPGTTRSKVMNEANFYVCRPLWTPSVIVETSFMCNIWDFAWLTDENAQNAMSDEITLAILDYYK